MAVLHKTGNIPETHPMLAKTSSEGGIQEVPKQIDAADMRLSRLRASGKPDGWEATTHIGSWFERAIETDPEWKDFTTYCRLNFHSEMETSDLQKSQDPLVRPLV